MVAEVQAVYMGEHGKQDYWVNVKTANPTGNIGDGGVIRRFKTKEEAKEYAHKVNETGVDVFVHKPQVNDNEGVRHAGDEFISSKNTNKTQTYTEPPEISWGRAVTGFLTQDQIDAINETRRLPDNVKIMQNGAGGYVLVYNYFGIRPGTQTVPEGFEIKQDVIGVAHVLPKDTNGLMIK